MRCDTAEDDGRITDGSGRELQPENIGSIMLLATPFGLFPVGEFRGAQGTATKFAGKYTTERPGARM